MRHYKKHGMTNTKEYQVWIGIKKRCYNKSNKDYYNYGGRGINVCDEWVNDFMSFYNDMGTKPSESHSIERLDVNGSYSPDNCVWADNTTQSRNRRVGVNNNSGYKGVYWCKKNKKWRSYIYLNKKRIHLGYYLNIVDAVKARKEAEVKFWGC